jgi:hypothetical protein
MSNVSESQKSLSRDRSPETSGEEDGGASDSEKEREECSSSDGENESAEKCDEDEGQVDQKDVKTGVPECVKNLKDYACVCFEDGSVCVVWREWIVELTDGGFGSYYTVPEKRKADNNVAMWYLSNHKKPFAGVNPDMTVYRLAARPRIQHSVDVYLDGASIRDKLIRKIERGKLMENGSFLASSCEEGKSKRSQQRLRQLKCVDYAKIMNGGAVDNSVKGGSKKKKKTDDEVGVNDGEGERVAATYKSKRGVDKIGKKKRSSDGECSSADEGQSGNCLPQYSATGELVVAAKPGN